MSKNLQIPENLSQFDTNKIEQWIGREMSKSGILVSPDLMDIKTLQPKISEQEDSRIQVSMQYAQMRGGSWQPENNKKAVLDFFGQIQDALRSAGHVCTQASGVGFKHDTYNDTDIGRIGCEIKAIPQEPAPQIKFGNFRQNIEASSPSIENSNQKHAM